MKSQRTISYAAFGSLCRTKYKIAAPEALLQYLHRSGHVFYRSGAFGNQIVLDLDWVLVGIYAVFDRDRTLPILRLQGGRFTPRLLAALVWSNFTSADHQVFISLMEQCQICFRTGKDVYIAPNALPPDAELKDDIGRIWRGAAVEASAHLHYLFLHEGVLRATLCGLGQRAGESAVYWAYGMCFYDGETRSVVRIASQYADPTGADPSGKITIEASGPLSSALVSRLVQSIQRINIGAPPEIIWTAGEPMKEPADSKEPDRLPQPFAMITPAEAPRPSGEPRPVYVSYAWGESDALVDEFERKLPSLLHTETR